MKALCLSAICSATLGIRRGRTKEEAPLIRYAAMSLSCAQRFGKTLCRPPSESATSGAVNAAWVSTLIAAGILLMNTMAPMAKHDRESRWSNRGRSSAGMLTGRSTHRPLMPAPTTRNSCFFCHVNATKPATRPGPPAECNCQWCGESHEPEQNAECSMRKLDHERPSAHLSLSGRWCR